MKVSFKANKGNKFWAFGYCPLNTGFTVALSRFELLGMCSAEVR